MNLLHLVLKLQLQYTLSDSPIYLCFKVRLMRDEGQLSPSEFATLHEAILERIDHHVVLEVHLSVPWEGARSDMVERRVKFLADWVAELKQGTYSMAYTREIEIWEMCKAQLKASPTFYYVCNILSTFHGSEKITGDESDYLLEKISSRLHGHGTYLNYLRGKGEGLTSEQILNKGEAKYQADLRLAWLDSMIAELKEPNYEG